MAGSSGIKINYRWLLQALAFIGCIFAFLQIWELSKQLQVTLSLAAVLRTMAFSVLFFFCFFLMALTSYLKQKVNGTLKNQLAFFEKVIDRFNLTILASAGKE